VEDENEALDAEFSDVLRLLRAVFVVAVSSLFEIHVMIHTLVSWSTKEVGLSEELKFT